MLQIEKWELGPRTGRQLTLRSTNPQIPTKIQEITIVPNTVAGAPPIVNGAPLVLEFAKIFLRQPVPPEGNLTITMQDLSTWAAGML
jgi:hypothetical protein